MKLEELMEKMGRGVPPETHWTLALDPGDTTGIAVFQGPSLFSFDQVPSKGMADALSELLEYQTYNQIIIESYRVYQDKAQAHVRSDVPTLQLIGVLRYIIERASMPYRMQSASQAKAFQTNDKLREWGFWQGHKNKHAHDAIRHACYYFLFGKDKTW